ASWAAGASAATAWSIGSGPQARTSKPAGTSSVTSVGSSATSAPGRSAAASACQALRKPRTAGGRRSRSDRYGSGAIPTPPPPRSGFATPRRKPRPSGPNTVSSSPGPSSHSARVPGPIGSIRNPSSPCGARQRLMGRGRTRPRASSMKNWPGSPGSSPPRSTRRSTYGPTRSAARTLRRSRLRMLDPLLERERELGAGARDRVDGRGRAGDRRDARKPRDEGRLADPVAVRACAGARRRVHDEVDAPPPDQVDDLLALADSPDLEPGGREHVPRPLGRDELEPEAGQRGRDRHDRRLVVVPHGQKRGTRRRQPAP